MLSSMTGFSSSILSLPFKNIGKIQMTITLKSLNSRFFEVNCKLPYALSHLETRLIKLFKTNLHRGNIFCTVHMTNSSELTTQVLPSMSIVDGYLKAINQIKTKFNLFGELSVDRLISLPHVFELPEEPIDEETANLVFDAFEKLVKDLLEVRKKEGQVLLADIEARVNNIESDVKEIEKRAPAVAQARKEALISSFETLAKEQNAQSGETNPHAFLYSQLEKIDIHEEIVRAKSHIDNLKSTLKKDLPEHGKKLDFILQELFREINTMAAKCADSQISNAAINIKVELEKAREQVQNIV